MERADQMLAYCLLLLTSKGEKMTPSQPSFFNENAPCDFFSLLTFWALSFARKDFKVEHHPLLPKISLGLIALQFSDYCVYEYALRFKKICHFPHYLLICFVILLQHTPIIYSRKC